MPEITVEGKPQLFFSSSGSDKPWRLVEQIAAVIESFFQEKNDVYAYSPARIPNVVGDPTEVDVAYSYTPDPRDAFRFVQVRDRNDVQGRPWVEQVLGQQQSLDIRDSTMVSTELFSGNARCLAKKKNVRLRVLLPETEEAIKQWYKPDTIGVHRPLSKIVKAVMIAKIGEKSGRFDADAAKANQNNILVETEKPGYYRVVSIAQVFDVEVMMNTARSDELLKKAPDDSGFHNAVVGIEWKHPHLFLSLNKSHNARHNEPPVCPITGMVFDVQVSKQAAEYSICYRYRYLNEEGSLIAQAIVSRVNSIGRDSHICLVRHHIDSGNRLLGGAFFQ
ncbi:MAG: hypothetical protein A2147_00655 [Chloroflexi bacterium RBG_16_57_8]|nr:MAG: hypothetical protein A2147_00655 [Chloroflexi bacterium RBG_16_57_8]